MLPIINLSAPAVPAQPSLVATALPENSTLRVPATNVPPSVSSAQINNNARGNGVYAAIASAGYNVPVASANPAQSVAAAIAQTAASSSVSAPFIAQLIGQQSSAVSQSALGGVLAEYEKMLASSYVKYRPSNATLPPPPPSGVYGKILQENRMQGRTQPVPPVAQNPQPVAQSQPVAPVIRDTAPVEPVQQVASAPQPSAASTTASAPIVLPTSAASAYQASAVRVETAAPSTVTEAI